MTAASRLLAMSLRIARFASGLLPNSYTASRDAIVDFVITNWFFGLSRKCPEYTLVA